MICLYLIRPSGRGLIGIPKTGDAARNPFGYSLKYT